jgi:RNA polymerase sigma-70 factor, ECF subfamily
MSPPVAQEARADVAFERLYEQHRGDVYRFVLRDVRNPADAEDVTQTAFLNAYRALKHGDRPEKPRAWLFTIAQNVARRRFRSSASRPLEVSLDPDLAAAPEVESPTAAEIGEALGRLRPNYRSVLILREIGGLSYAEVAEHLGLSVAAVETLIFRARRALREELAPEERRRISVGGVVLWPLPDVLSNLFGSAGGWFARQGLAAKVAAVGGAAVLGTGAAVQTGQLSLPNGGSSQVVLVRPVQSEVAGGDATTAASAGPKRAGGGAVKAAKTESRKGSGRAAASTSAAGAASEPGEEQPAAGAKAPAVDLPEAGVPDASVPPVDVPSLGVGPVDDVVAATEGTVGKVVEPVNKVVAPVVEPVNEAAAPVLEPVKKAAEPVVETVKPLLPKTNLPLDTPLDP